MTKSYRYQLPDLGPACPCPACVELARRIDADLAARLAVREAAARVDREHRLWKEPVDPQRVPVTTEEP